MRPEQLIVDAVHQTTTAVGSLQTSLLQSLQANFGQLDTSLNGTLDLGEFTKGLSKFASEDTSKPCSPALDANGDGQLTRLEALGATAISSSTPPCGRAPSWRLSSSSRPSWTAFGSARVAPTTTWPRCCSSRCTTRSGKTSRCSSSTPSGAAWATWPAPAGGRRWGDSISIRVVTASGTEMSNTVITNLKERSRRARSWSTPAGSAHDHHCRVLPAT